MMEKKFVIGYDERAYQVCTGSVSNFRFRPLSVNT